MSIKVLEQARKHPARDASIHSITCVQNGDREDWLSMWHPDGVIEDPVGPSPLDPCARVVHAGDSGGPALFELEWLDFPATHGVMPQLVPLAPYEIFIKLSRCPIATSAQ